MPLRALTPDPCSFTTLYKVFHLILFPRFLNRHRTHHPLPWGYPHRCRKTLAPIYFPDRWFYQGSWGPSVSFSKTLSLTRTLEILCHPLPLPAGTKILDNRSPQAP